MTLEIRYRGHSALDGLEADTRVGFKMSFNEFVSGRRFQDMKKLNLMGTEGDASLLRETVAYSLLAKMGVAAPFVNYAEVYADGEFLGVFPLTEEPDDEPFLEKHFSDDTGHLYRVGGYCGGKGTFEYKDEDPLSYSETYEPRADTLPEHLLEDLVPLTKCVAEIEDAAFEACVDTWVDVDSFFTLAAADILFPDVDGMMGNGQNFMMYRDPAIDKFVFYAWDKDQALSTYNLVEDWSIYRVYPPWGESFYSLLGSRLIELRRQTYCDKLLEVADYYDPDVLLPEIDALAKFLGPRVEADPFLDADDWSYGVEDVVEIVADRHESVVALATVCAPAP